MSASNLASIRNFSHSASRIPASLFASATPTSASRLTLAVCARPREDRYCTLSYELQAAKEKQKIRSEEIEIDIVERRKQIAIEEKEILRKEKELTATVKLPAESESYKVQTIAEGARTQTVEAARADAERIRLIGASEAAAIEAVGNAEAERMRLKAAAYKQYGNAAMLSLVLDTLPKVAAEVAAPLAKTEQIVMVGDDRATSEVSRLVSNLPPAVQALTGVDLSKMMSKIPGASV